MAVAIISVIGVIIGIIVARYYYVSCIKVCNKTPTGVFFGIVAPIGICAVVSLFASVLLFALWESFYHSQLEPEDFEYQREIPIQDVMFAASESSFNYIALDGTFRNATSNDILVNDSPDENVHIVSMYKTDLWADGCEIYKVNVMVPDPSNKSKSDALKEVAEQRRELADMEFEDVPHFSDSDGEEDDND